MNPRWVESGKKNGHRRSGQEELSSLFLAPRTLVGVPTLVGFYCEVGKMESQEPAFQGCSENKNEIESEYFGKG